MQDEFEFRFGKIDVLNRRLKETKVDLTQSAEKLKIESQLNQR